jgi:serine/threonine protein kinase
MTDSDKPNNKNDATVIRPRKKTKSPDHASSDREPAPPPPERTVLKTGPSLKTAQVQALTQISNALKSSDSSTGFENARKAANAALASNKIILNNRFVLDSTIGSGGMGTVYKARDLRKVEANHRDPSVAIKVLNQDFQNHPDAFVTLQREASKAQSLAHPNIVSVHDFDRDGDVIYMTMELLVGQDLESRIASQPNGMEVDEALKLIKGYCAALIHAHGKNIVHSDLKPGNIYITRDGAKVLDFGIARFTSSTLGQDNFDAGALGALTPAYASLEMLRRDPPDQGDDVYAAAVIAYELLSGKHPYQRKPADQALAENLKPERIDKLNKRQWQALESALKLRRSERTPSVQQFLNELTYVRRNTPLKIAVAMLLLVTAVLGYYEFLAPNELSAVIATTLKKGSQCYVNQDYVCAIESANAILKLEPANKPAKELFQQSTDAYTQTQEKKFTDAALTCVESDDFDCAHVNLAALKQAAPESTRIAVIQNKIELKQAYNAATKCFAEQRYDCAVENSTLMLAKDPNNQSALDITRRAREQQEKNQIKAASSMRDFNGNMANAQACFVKRDYDCSMQYARQALLNKPGDASAEAFLQKSSYAKAQQQESLAKARNVLNQGVACYKQKNFSCAIAKSESALEFMPDFQDAIRLKQDAQQEITKLKRSFEIQ